MNLGRLPHDLTGWDDPVRQALHDVFFPVGHPPFLKSFWRSFPPPETQTREVPMFGSVAVFCFAISWLSSSNPNLVEQDKTGVKVGEKAPAFALKDQKGQERKLADLLGKGPVALVFFRSAEW